MSEETKNNKVCENCGKPMNMVATMPVHNNIKLRAYTCFECGFKMSDVPMVSVNILKKRAESRNIPYPPETLEDLKNLVKLEWD